MGDDAMTFTTLSASDDWSSGTHLQGYLPALPYRRLVEVFGEPTYPDGDMDKTQVEWFLRFGDGTIATIYDYKMYGCDIRRLAGYEWHVGGFEVTAVERVYAALGLPAPPKEG